MFTVLIVQPIFNLLVLVYALLPGHNFGLALIIFTIIVRLILWPLVRRQLHHTKALRKLQPELKKIKQAAKGDRQKEAQMMMELYKEREINQFAPLGLLAIQFIVLIGLYSGLRKVIDNPHELISFAYPGLQHLSWMKELAVNIHRFDNTLFGLVDLSRSATGAKGLYWPAMIVVLASAIMQYYQAKQLMPDNKEKKSLRSILKDASQKGQAADTADVNAAMSSSMRYVMPVMIFLFTVNLPSALSLYWFIGGVMAYIQQSIGLREDEEEMEELADKPAHATSPKKKPSARDRAKKALEAQIVAKEKAAASGSGKKGTKK